MRSKLWVCVDLSYHSNISGHFSLPQLLLFSRRHFWLNTTADRPDLALTITGKSNCVISIAITANKKLSTQRGNPQPCSPKPPSLDFRHCFFFRTGKANATSCIRGKKKSKCTMLVQMSWKSGIKSPWLSDDLQNCSLQALQVTVFNWAGLRVDFKCQNACF